MVNIMQGDLLSSMLFVLVMECPNPMINKVERDGLLQSLGCNMKCMTSLYADDLVLFLFPVYQDLVVVKEILSCFEHVHRLSTNFAKTKVFPINYSEEQEAFI